MWGGPGCAGNWSGDGWGNGWDDWSSWGDGWYDEGWNQPWPPAGGKMGKGRGVQAAGGKPPMPPAAPVPSMPPIKDVASLVSQQLFAGQKAPGSEPTGPAQPQTAVTPLPPPDLPAPALPPPPPQAQEVGNAVGSAGKASSLDTAALLAYQQMQQQEYADLPDGGPFGGLSDRDITSEVQNLMSQYKILDKKIEIRLIEALKLRGDRWGADLQDFRSCLSRARNPAGFLIVKLSDMEKAINAEKGTNIGGGREFCANYRRGHCNRGDACKYSHDVQVGLSKANVANLIAEAQKNVANMGFGFSAPGAPPALPPAPVAPVAPAAPVAPVAPVVPAVERVERQEPRWMSRSPRRSPPRRRSRSVRRSPPRRRTPPRRDSRARRSPRRRSSRSRGRRR
ncbi:unnamed protein product [Durusdinium trenchii]|uniref:C3H1-type domain-containing protein n=1 Tax=Durusdinium trenchii TaxID=1381693 RepID=A0ABP0LVV3_9DINO